MEFESAPNSFHTFPTRRYRRDFQEEGLIAQGSFGDVYRTRHRLDGTR